MRHALALRMTLVLAIVLSTGAGLVDVLVPDAVPAGSRDAFRALTAARPPASGALLALAGIYWLVLAAAAVGLFRLRRWGLWLGLLVTAVTMAQAVALGPHAYSGLAFMVSYVAKLAWGATLALAWVATRAERPAVEHRAAPA